MVSSGSSSSSYDSSSSDSSDSSSRRHRRRRQRGRRDRDRDRDDALKTSKKDRSIGKRRRRHRRRHSSSGSESSSDYSSDTSESGHESRSVKRRKNDRSKKHKEKIEAKVGAINMGSTKSKSHMQNRQDEGSSGPVQLSKFLGKDQDDDACRSAVSGKKILLKVEKSKEDKLAESKRSELLKFLNASYD